MEMERLSIIMEKDIMDNGMVIG